MLIVVVNAIASQRGDTILLRGCELPVLGQVDVSAEALVEGAILALRITVVVCAFAVYSACVDPDRVLRLLRPFARHSALTATLITRLVPLAAADNARLREARALRGPAAAPVGPRRADPPAGRRLARPRGRRRGDARAARLRARGAAGAAPGDGAPATTGASPRPGRRCWRSASAPRSPASADFEAYPTVDDGRRRRDPGGRRGASHRWPRFPTSASTGRYLRRG